MLGRHRAALVAHRKVASAAQNPWVRPPRASDSFLARELQSTESHAAPQTFWPSLAAGLLSLALTVIEDVGRGE